MSTQLTADVLADVPAESAKKLEGYAKAIQKANAKGMALTMEIGRNLRLAHDELAQHRIGEFGKWVEGSCGFSRQSAHRYMRVFEVFGEINCNSLLQNATAEALYFLSSESTPQDAIDDAIASAGLGDRVTLAAAKEFVAKYTVDEASDGPADDWELFPCVEQLRKYVGKMYERWPKEDIEVLPGKLRSLADDIEAGDFDNGEDE